MNAYSIVHNYDKDGFYQHDYDLIGSALSFKQQKYDTNKAKLQNLYNNFKMLDVHNDVDQDYIEHRLRTARDIVAKYDNIDFSDDAFATSMLNNIGQVFDDKVENAIVSTRLINAENAAWQKLQVEDPGKFSQTNRAYALSKSDRGRYESATEAGALYQGGAGVIEYTDVEGLITKNLPEIANRLKATFVKTGAGNGVFMSTETYEEIPRDKVEAALVGMLDQKAMNQLRINAWAKYDNVSDTSLKNYYDANRDAQISSSKNNISKYEALEQSATGSQKSQYKNLINQEKKNILNLQGRTYESLGKEAVYTNIYFEDFKNGYLDAYSKEPTLIKEEVNALDEATKNYEIKLRQEARSDAYLDIAKANLEISVDKWNWEKAGGRKGNQTTGAGAQVQEGVFLGEDREMTPIDNLENEIVQNQKIGREALKGMENLVGSLQGADYNSLRKEFADLPGKIQKGGTILINGKKIDVKKNAKTLLAFQNEVLQENQGEKMVKDGLTSLTGVIENRLRKFVTSSSADFNPYEVLTHYDFKIQKNPKTGKLEKVPLQNPKANNYVRLLKKDPKDLTDDEKITLTTYLQIQMISDTGLPFQSGLRQELLKTMSTRTLKGVSSTEISKILKDGARAYRKEGFTAQFIPTSTNPITHQNFLSSLTDRDTEYYDKNGKEVSYSNFNTLVGESFSQYLNPAYSELGKRTQQLRQQSLNITKDAKGYDNIKTLLSNKEGGVPSSFSGAIAIVPLLDPKTKKETGMSEIIAFKDVKGEKVEVRETVDNNYLAQNGIDLKPVRRAAYSLSYGDNAGSIQMGSSDIYSANDYIANNLDDILYSAAEQGVTNDIKTLLNRYRDGDYKFSIEPVNGQYYQIIRDENNRVVFTNPEALPYQDFDYEDFSNSQGTGIYDRAFELNSSVMLGYVQDEIKKSALRNKTSRTENILR